MNSDVLFEDKDNKMIITLDKNADYSDIKDKIVSILDASTDIFNDVVGPITIKGKRLSDFEESELISIISAKTDLEIVIEKPKKMGLATINNIFTKDMTVSTAKIYEGTVRSGQRVEYEGSVIVLGDVNAGSEVVAEQNIVVLGDVRGYVHAGAKGNRACIIAANSINPTQLRIADLIYKQESKVDVENGYEIARVKMGEITIEE